MVEVRKSINIKYDSHNKKLINDYFPTSSHSEIIRQVLSGMQNGNNRSHIMFGPYGAGKSFISAILAGLSRGQYTKDDVAPFINKFKLVDIEISNQLEQFIFNKTKYIPVILNGYEGEFSEALIKRLNLELKNNGVNIFEHKSDIKKIVTSWKDEFPIMYKELLYFLKENDLTEKKFLKTSEIDDNYILFKKFYKNITGKELGNDNFTEDLISYLERASILLKQENKGIFLIYDEFGRVLQNLQESQLNRFLQQLQDLAELINNSRDNITILFIAHKPLSHYFTYLDKDKRNEFLKIEKRFSVTHVQSDHATFINIASQFVGRQNLNKINDKTFSNYSKNLSKYRLFSHYFNQTEIDNLIIRNGYPIHPVALFLLPIISKVFGQNERTLFTFLSDTSHNGFLSFINRAPNEIYYSDYLIDYFFIDLEDKFENKEINTFIDNFYQIDKYSSKNIKKASQRVFKLISLWSITNANNFVALSDDFISFALDLSINTVSKALRNLINLKLIRFDLNRNFWYIIEPSSIDIDAEVAKKLNYIRRNPILISQMINKYNPYKFIYSTRHNIENEITRFATSLIMIEGYPAIEIDKGRQDIVYNHFINIENLKNSGELFSFTNCNLSPLIKLLERLTTIDLLLKDEVYLYSYKNSIVDLEFEKERVLEKLSKYYNSLINNKIHYKNKEFIVNDLKSFSYLFSNIVDEIFNKTIIIKNDQINMFVITSQQKKAIIKIINEIIISGNFELDEVFNKSKPEDLIYYSIKSAMKQDSFHSLKDTVTNYLITKNSDNFSALTDIASKPPYGLRPTITSLIVLIIIIDRFKNMLFSRDNNYIANLDAEQIYNAAFHINDFKYVYSDFEFQYNEWIDSILDYFPEPSENVTSKSQSIKVLSAMFSWFNTLPVITQQGENLGIKERYFLRYIEQSRIDPLKALLDLVQIEPLEILEMKEIIENSYQTYLDRIEGTLLKEFQLKDWNQLKDKVDLIHRKTNNLMKIIYMDKNILRSYSEIIDSLDIERWTKASYEKLLASIRSDYRQLQDKINTIIVEVDGKKKEIQDIMIGSKATTLKKNLMGLIDANLKYVPSFEVEKLLIELIDKYIK